MKNGNWVPMDKAWVEYLPVKRPYSEIEAIFCLQVYYDDDTPVSVLKLSREWNWDRKKVRAFLKKVGIKIAGCGRGKGQSGVIVSDSKDLTNSPLSGHFTPHFKSKDISNLQNKKDINLPIIGTLSKNETENSNDSEHLANSPLSGHFAPHVDPNNINELQDDGDINLPIIGTLSKTIHYLKKNKEYIYVPFTGDDSSVKEGEKKKKKKNKKNISKPRIPYQKIIDLYNDILGSDLPVVKIVSDKRKRAIKRIWQEQKSMQNYEKWEEFFRHVSDSEFLMGRNSRNWSADFDWLLKYDNFVKVVEGKYHNNRR